MKKLLAFFLALLTVLSAMPAVSAAPGKDASGVAPKAETLPKAFSLVDDTKSTGTLPPIDDQGQIGSCVGQAVTYMQFSNAVATYMQKVKHQTNWKPNDGSPTGDDTYIFSPKWTLNYSGAGTQWVYEILVHMGAPVQDLSKFYKGNRYQSTIDGNASLYYSGSYPNGTTYNPNTKYYTETTSWDVKENNDVDIMETALGYRFKEYDQVWTKDVGGGQITTTEAGKALLKRIKESVKAGNVVVTGGPSGKWGYQRQNCVGKLTGKGDIGKVGEYCCFAAQGNYGGGHQVSIVGWDDNVVYAKNGVTMKGAFLVANSWATSWMNSGYMWFMYDSINKKSEFATTDKSLDEATREFSLDQFCFTKWEDIEVGQPELTVSAEITTKNREGTSLLLTRTDPKTGTTVTYQPKIFYYGDMGVHETYDLPKPHYFNYEGKVDGEDATAHFTFSYEDIYDSMAEGKEIKDYVWGFQVVVDKGNIAKVGEVELKSNLGANKEQKSLFKKTLNMTVDGSKYDVKAYVACDTKNYILADSSNMFTVTPAGGSASPVNDGGSYKFKVEPAKGYTLAYATVLANGTPIFPDNDGVYTIPNVKSSYGISVSGIVEDASYKKFSPVMYNGDGWEYYDNQYLMVVQVPSTTLRRDLYADNSKIGTENYPYWFRLTDQATNTSYYMQPSSIYDFGGDGNILYRLPFLNAGLSVKEDQSYTFTVDVLYEGHVLYTGNMTTKCHFADDNADTSKKPPQKESETVKPSGNVHTITYTYNGKTLGKDAFLEGSKIVPRVATSDAEFVPTFDKTVPEKMDKTNISVKVTGTAYGRGDITDDGKVNMKDLSRLCQYLGKNDTKCNKELVDANGDGKVQIDDLTYLLGKFSTPVYIMG